ncbi:hypothetical protein BX616_000758 [Lobosporangium transversale]|uniref:Uncharacterized protein n=1 Tax=Lobosporangium transversale TaxID=64571 RepID=A0A1Y2GR66_9FUNG|nr:hypothetical protein BCR41DRAFT_80362 [Lobosporangium transversale]KAF9906324.1 hypothetical protein BX616_000758 [Lobosporangium transversale]ORZ14948.1 hypothetical protein BCR41DRAFT_80362 [Lobosporangium transversale]|eukprot:XP_021881080.1 hypothetical protein BCR41DRAFT_80362 [Lobosporangium transversale]
MHHLHQADANHGHENESTPFLASAASAQQQQQPASSRSPSRSPRLDYRSVNRSYSPLKQIDSHCNNDNSSNNNRNKGKSKKNTKSPFDSDSDSDQDGDHPGGLASSASSISSLLPDDQENSPISPSTSPLTQRRRGHRLHYLQMLLAIAAQLGLLIFFGTLAGVTAKAPWVYPYSWHPICMGLYGFVATEGKYKKPLHEWTIFSEYHLLQFVSHCSHSNV